MQVNLFLNKISYASSKEAKKGSGKESHMVQNPHVQNLEKTPDYLVKTPQKFVKTDCVDLPENLKAHVYRLESGQRVVIVPKKGPTVIKTYVNTGSFNEKDSQRGISHFVEHSLFNGSDGLEKGEFFETVNKMGANTNASTSFSATDYYIKSNLLKDTDFEKQIKIHASMLETPKFSLDMIEKEKGPVTSEISMILDDMENVAVNTTIKSLFNIKTTSQDVIAGTIENINSLTREKVLDYYKQNYYPANMVTVITGDVDEKETMKLVSKYMQSKKRPQENRTFEELSPIDKSVRKDITSGKTNIAIISLGFKGPENENLNDRIMFEAVEYALTSTPISRINKQLEKVHSTAAFDMERLGTRKKDSTALLLNAKVSDNNVEKAIENINSAIESLKTNPVTEDELISIKKNLKMNFLSGFDSSHNINSLVGSYMFDGDLSKINQCESIIDNLTVQDFVNFTNKYLNTKKEAITVIHPEKTKNNVAFGSRKPINTEEIDTKTLKNNIVLVENDTDKNIAYIKMKFTNDYQKEKSGASTILALMLMRGTKDKNKEEFFRNVEKDGVKLRLSSNYNSIQANAECVSQDSGKSIGYLKEVLLNPRFTKEDFEKSQKELLQLLKGIPPSAKNILHGEILKGTAEGVTVNQLIEEVQNTTLDDVKNYYNDLFYNSQAQVSICGPFKNQEFKNSIEESLSKGFPTFNKTTVYGKKSYTPVEKQKVLTQSFNNSQAEIISAYKFKVNDLSPENVARYALLNIILGGTSSSRLFNDLRETQKLAYNVQSNIYYNDTDTGVCSLFIKTTTDSDKTYKNIEKSIKGFDYHVNKMLNEKVTEEELENAKRVYKNSIYNFNETDRNKGATLLSTVRSNLGIEYTNKAMDIVDKITVEDIQNTAREIFRNPPVYSIVAKEEALSENREFLKSKG